MHINSIKAKIRNANQNQQRQRQITSLFLFGNIQSMVYKLLGQDVKVQKGVPE